MPRASSPVPSLRSPTMAEETAASSPSPSLPPAFSSPLRRRTRSKSLAPPPAPAEAAATPTPPSPKTAPSLLPSDRLPHARGRSTPLLHSPKTAPSPHSSSKASSASLPWYWAIEALADCKLVETSVIKALLRNAPDFSAGAPGPVKERLSFRCLEELLGIDRGEVPPDWASTVGIDASQSCEEVLCREAGKFCRIANVFNLGKDRVNLLTHDLQKFIIKKRNSLPKSSLDKIKEMIGHENCPALMPLLEDHGFSIQNEVAHPQCKPVDANSRRVNNLNFKVSLSDAEIQLLKRSSSVAPNNCNTVLQEEHPGSMQKFPEQNVSGADRMLKRRNANTGGNGQLRDKEEQLKKIKLQSIDKDLGVLAPISDPCVSPEDLSQPMGNVFKQNVDHAETVSTGVHNVQTIGQGLQNVDVAETLSTGVDVQATQQGSTSEEPDPSKMDAFEGEQNLPDVLNDDKYSNVPSDSFAKVNGPADSVKDDKKDKWQHPPIKGPGENIHPPLSEKNNFNLNVAPGMVSDDNSCDVPPNVDTGGGGALDGEKRSCLANTDNGSVIYPPGKRGLCVKCKKGGEILICCGSGCMVSVHSTCLGASLKFDKSGLFFCPFCSYERAAVAYGKEKDKFYQACKLLSDFTGRDFVQGHHREWSPLCVLTEDFQMRDASNCNELNVSLSRCTRDKLFATSVRDNDQTYNREVTRSYDDSKYPCREGQALGNERISDISHHAAELNYDKAVDEVTETTHNSNADPSSQKIVPQNNGQQVDFLEHPLPGKHSNKDHLASKEDPCHAARYVHDMVQGGSGINEKLHMQRMKDQMRKKDQGTGGGEESSGGKSGSSREDKMVVYDHRNKMTSLGKPGMSKSRVTRYTNPILPAKRRNKLIWTEAEIEYLKEAMKKLGENYSGPIPWVNILEEGRRVLHGTRLPGDLKDKWRNMKRREGSSATTS